MSGRSLGEVWKVVWQNFKQSFKGVHTNDICVGKDHFGNRYFEKIAGKCYFVKVSTKVLFIPTGSVQILVQFIRKVAKTK